LARFANLLRASRVFRAGLALLAIGWGPLLLYIVYESLSGQTGGNPIGLGLLMFFSTPIALALLLASAVAAAVATRGVNR
jgi:hypothetical protein